MDKYNSKKQINQEVLQLIHKHLTEKGIQRFEYCGNWIDFFTDKELTKYKVNNADFCNHRFCPICMWRSARKDSLKISVLLDYLEQEFNRAFIFLTLTAPNVTAAQLSAEITKYNKKFKELMRRDVVEKMNDGFIRKLEITYNGDLCITDEYYYKCQSYCDYMGLKIGDLNPNYDTYHTHFHCIFSVPKYYFKSKLYIKQEKWLELWRDVMQDPSITQVDVRRVKRGDSGKTAGDTDAKGTTKVRDKAQFEIAKYAAKDTDFVYSQEVFDVFYNALRGRQVLTYGGSFAAANKKYKAKELEHYKTVDDTDYVYLVYYKWLNEYVEQKRKMLTPEMYQALKKTALDDAPI